MLVALRTTGYPPRSTDQRPVVLSRVRRHRPRRHRAALPTATIGRPWWALFLAVVGAFAFLLLWGTEGPNTTGLGLCGTVVLLTATVYLFPRLPGRLLDWSGGSADTEGTRARPDGD